MGVGADVVNGLYAAFAKGDVPGVLASFDPRIEWREAEGFRYADRNPYIGPQAVAEGVFQRIVSDVDQFTVVPENVIDANDTVVVEGRYKGTMKSTGTPVDAQFVHVWRLRQGKIIRFQQYTDTAQWARAAGG
jgi:ketosteroid isomerase-like protein